VTRTVRPADELLAPALEATLTALTLTPADQAAVALARHLAAAIDHGEARLTTAAPTYLATLAQLGATPTARKTTTSAGEADHGRAAPKSPLAQLRDARRPA